VGWKTRAMGRAPLKGYFFSGSSDRSNPKPGFSGSGKRPLTMRMAGNPSHSSQTFSVGPGATPLHTSCTRKLGMAASTWRVAMPAMVPLPKTGKGIDLTCHAPSHVPERQLRELRISVRSRCS